MEKEENAFQKELQRAIAERFNGKRGELLRYLRTQPGLENLIASTVWRWCSGPTMAPQPETQLKVLSALENLENTDNAAVNSFRVTINLPASFDVPDGSSLTLADLLSTIIVQVKKYNT